MVLPILSLMMLVSSFTSTYSLEEATVATTVFPPKPLDPVLFAGMEIVDEIFDELERAAEGIEEPRKTTMVTATQTTTDELESYVEESEKLLDGIATDYNELPNFDDANLGKPHGLHDIARQATTEKVPEIDSHLKSVMDKAIVTVENAINITNLHFRRVKNGDAAGTGAYIFLFVASLVIFVGGLIYRGHNHINWEYALVVLKMKKPNTMNTEVRMSDLQARELVEI